MCNILFHCHRNHSNTTENQSIIKIPNVTISLPTSPHRFSTHTYTNQLSTINFSIPALLLSHPGRNSARYNFPLPRNFRCGGSNSPNIISPSPARKQHAHTLTLECSALAGEARMIVVDVAVLLLILRAGLAEISHVNGLERAELQPEQFLQRGKTIYIYIYIYT